MNVLFSTQTELLKVFLAMSSGIRERRPGSSFAFTVSDSLFYEAFVRKNPQFEATHTVLKEWRLTGQREGVPDYAKLRAYEEKLGEPGLFGAIVADRRLIFGPNTTFSEDRRRRFSDEELLRILVVCTEAMDRLFREFKPDVVVGFQCNTILAYLALLFAKNAGVRYLNLRPTRITNRMIFSSTVRDPAPEVVESYNKILRHGSPFLSEATSYLSSFKDGPQYYEGVTPPSRKIARTAKRTGGLAKSVGSLATTSWRYYRTDARTDNHCPNPLKQALYLSFLNKVRANISWRFLTRHVISLSSLEDRRFVFYPLHTEPEVSLQVYSRPLGDQIEVIRWLALSLPADMVLVVKEHPWMLGKRPISAYRRMLEIPRVRIADPAEEGSRIAAQADLTAVLTSSVGQEAAFLGKPVLAFGCAPILALPRTMVRPVSEITDLSTEISALLSEYRCEPEALAAYVAAIMECSVAVNWYTVLLGRTAAFQPEETSFDSDIEKLTDYFLEKADALPATSATASRW